MASYFSPDIALLEPIIMPVEPLLWILCILSLPPYKEVPHTLQFQSTQQRLGEAIGSRMFCSSALMVNKSEALAKE